MALEDPERVVTDAVARQLGSYNSLPDHLRELVERHCDNLVILTKDMQAAGQDPVTIRAMVSALVAAYETDLIKVIETWV